MELDQVTQALLLFVGMANVIYMGLMFHVLWIAYREVKKQSVIQHLAGQIVT